MVRISRVFDVGPAICRGEQLAVAVPGFSDCVEGAGLGYALIEQARIMMVRCPRRDPPHEPAIRPLISPYRVVHRRVSWIRLCENALWSKAGLNRRSWHEPVLRSSRLPRARCDAA